MVLPESVASGSEAVFLVLRIDPSLYEFSLHMASEEGQAFSLGDWSVRHGLVAGVNASMFLPDNMTSTGYMRGLVHTNNDRIGSRLGAFFVAEPQLFTDASARLPRADILEKDHPRLERRLASYGVVVQNYRLMDTTGKLLWPEDGARHSRAVVSRDTAGNILFILAQEQLTVTRLAAVLQECDLRLSTVMYVEGGAQAGLFVQTGIFSPVQSAREKERMLSGTHLHVWKGRKSFFNLPGNPSQILPNIIGVRPRLP